MIVIDKAVEGVSELMLTRFLSRGRRALGLRGKVSVLLASSAQLRRLNRQFRGKNYPTDVLSFPSELAGYAGDIAISVDIARRNGKVLGHGAALEIKILTLHGLLHLAGYDHETDGGRMARQELRLRRALGLPGGLIERAQLEVSRPAKTEPVSSKQRRQKSQLGVTGEHGNGGHRGKQR